MAPERVVVTCRGRRHEFPAGFPAGLRVLAVDSNAVCLKELKFTLHLCSYRVTAMETAEEALEMFRRRPRGFDIVLTEVHMPGTMDGFDLLRHVKDHLPVILVTDDDDMKTVTRGVMEGACDFLAKPVRTEMVRTIWRHVVRRKLRLNVPPRRRQAPQVTSAGMNDPVVAAAVAAATVAAGGGRDGGGGQAAAAAGSIPYDQTLEAARAAEKSRLWAAGSSRGDHAGLDLEAARAAARRMAARASGPGGNYILPAQGLGKRGRFVWSPEVHALFVNAINELKDKAGMGIEHGRLKNIGSKADKANAGAWRAPKQIKQMLELEGVYVTKDQVSSHLQKYRIWCNKKDKQKLDRNFNISGRYRSQWKPLSPTPDEVLPDQRRHSMPTRNGRFNNQNRTTIDYESLIRQASLRRDVASAVYGRQASRGSTSNPGGFVPNECLQVAAMQPSNIVATTSHGAVVDNTTENLATASLPSNTTQPMQSNQYFSTAGLPTNVSSGAVYDPNPVTQEMSVPPQTTQEMLNWLSAELDADLNDGMLMDNLFDEAELCGTQGTPDFDATCNQFISLLQSDEGLDSDFPLWDDWQCTDGLINASGGTTLTEGLLNDPSLQDELENLNNLNMQ